MSKHRDDGDAAAELFGLIFIAIIGLFVGAVVAQNQKKKNIVQLPETLEPQPPSLQSEPQDDPVRIFALGTFTVLVFLVGVSMLAYSPATIVASLGVFLLSAVLGYFTVETWEKKQKARKAQEPPSPPKPATLDLPQTRMYTVSLPRGGDWEPERAYRFMEQILHKLGGRITFQIVATTGRIVWRILDLRAGVEPSVMTQAVGAFYPDAEVEVGPFVTEPYVAPFYRYVLRFKQAGDFVGPIRYVSELKQLDPLVAITQEMNSLGPGEQIIYTLFLSTFADFAYKEGEKLVTTPNIHPLQFISIQGWVDAGIKSATGKHKVEKYIAADQKVFQEKLNNPLYQGVFTVRVDAPTAERVADLSHLDSHVWQFVNQPYNALAWHPEPWPQSIRYVDSPQATWTTSTFGLLEAWLTNTNKSWQAHRLILEPRELASLWHLPHGEFTAPGIVWSHGKQVQLPQAMRGNQDGAYLGINRYAGQEVPVYLPEENRAHHMAVIGMTGTGKSTFLHHLIHQDILANRGLAVIDPHGSLVQNILQSQIPSWREADVVVLDLANEEFPPPLNLLAVPKGIEHGNAAGRLMAVLDKVYGGFQDKPRMADTLWSALVTLWQETNPTVRDVPRLFDDVAYRRRLVATVDNIVAEEFWDKFERQSEQQQEQLSYPVA